MIDISKSNLKWVLPVAAAVIVIAGLLFYSLWLLSPAETEEAVISPVIPEDMLAGTVGELEQGNTLAEANPEAITNPVRPPGASMPAAVFDTKGEVVSIREDAVVVKGSGENFTDQRARDLTVKFTSQTITFEAGQQVRYTGLEGLRHLELGQMILISSAENIRGKTEFTAAYINKL